MEKYISIMITLVLFVCTFLLKTGNGSESIILCETDSDGIPENAAYIDLLVPAENIADYTELNENNLKANSLENTAEIVGFTAGGYVSYAYHCSASTATEKLPAEKEEVLNNTFYLDESDSGSIKNFKIAYVSKNGDIIGVSQEVKLNPALEFAYLKLNGLSCIPQYSFLKKPLIYGILGLALVIEILCLVLNRKKSNI